MQSKDKLSPQEATEQKNFDVWEFSADLNFTQHVGSVQSTEELAKQCHISKDKYVLDVGCGNARTSCYLVKKYGCRIVGVDKNAKMVERAKINETQYNIGAVASDFVTTLILERLREFCSISQRRVEINAIADKEQNTLSDMESDALSINKELRCWNLLAHQHFSCSHFLL